MSNNGVGVCILVIDKSGRKILLGKKIGGYGNGMYGIPGGNLELGESLTDCAKRELGEETGLKDRKLKYLGVVREIEKNGDSYFHFVFICKDYKGSPKLQEPEECEGWDWYPLNNLPPNIMLGHKVAIEIYQNPQVSFRECKSNTGC